MTNYEAIRQMTPEQMEAFLDNVLLTGVNTGMYVAKLPEESDEWMDALDNNPFDEEWLAADAEDATQYVFADDGDLYLPTALCDVIMRVTGIDPDKED